MKNILITGGCGFIGANFIRYLLLDSDFDGRIINLDSLADIRDSAAIQRAFETHHIDAVCHFAAESHVDRSIAAPDAFIQTNINGTFNLLETARRYADRLVLFHHVSTDEVFGSLGTEGCFTEHSPYRPNSPYAASKAASDHLVRAYGKTYGLPVTISNCSNNYGPYQFPEKLIPLMILNALEGKSLPVYGDGRNVRDWLFVTDHCRAVWEIMKHGARGRMYNIGGRCEMTNLETVKMICDLLDELAPGTGAGSRRDLIEFVRDRPGHDLRYAIDCSRLEKELGWTPRESFETGLRKTIQWYLDHPQWVQRVKTGEYRKWIKRHYGQEA